MSCFFCSSFARPIVFDFQNEIKNAKKIVEVTVLRYENNTLTFRNNATSIIDSADVRCCKQLEKSVQEVDIINNSNGRGQFLTMSIPAINENVLIIIDNRNEVRLFAYKRDKYYRFWTPISSNSLTLFKYEFPALPITDNKSYNVGYGCFDGCLYPIDQLELRQ